MSKEAVSSSTEEKDSAANVTDYKKKKPESLDSNGYLEYYIAVIGSVDGGKSSTVGVLTTNSLDDGNGKARCSVFRHPHERYTGRTSDISYQYYKDEVSKRIITFIDLAGHEAYLRTTINGLSSGYPDIALVCISDKITNMTKEHIGLAFNMNIPIVLLFTKIDQVPRDTTRDLVKTMKKLLSTKLNRNLYHVKTENDYNLCLENQNTLVPFILTSNKTGTGLDLVKHVINSSPKKKRDIINGFSVEHIYEVKNYGTVVSGMVGNNVKKGDVLYIGPLRKCEFFEVRVKSLHNDFRYFVDELKPGTRGCLCINISRSNKRHLRNGMVLTHEKPKNICKKFLAKVKIFHHHTTIKPGYQAFANCGMICETVKFLKIDNCNGVDVDILRSGEEAIVELEFLKNLNYVEPGQSIVFREGSTRGIGTVEKIIEYKK